MPRDHLPLDVQLQAQTNGTRLTAAQACALEHLAIELLHRIRDDGYATSKLTNALRQLARPSCFTNRGGAAEAFAESLDALSTALAQLEHAITQLTVSL